MSVMGAQNKRTTTMGPFLTKGGKKARGKTLVVLRERWKQLTAKKPNYNASFLKMVSRSNTTVKTSDWPKHRLQWDVLEKGREKSPPKNVGRSQRTVKTSQWPKRTIDKRYVLTIERKQQTIVTGCSVTWRKRRICQWRKKTVSVLKKAGKCELKLTTIEKQSPWNQERTERYLERRTATKAEKRDWISLSKRRRTKLFWKEQLNQKRTILFQEEQL